MSRVFLWFKIVDGNFNYFNILFAFLLDLILFTKIISVRSNWKTLFLKSSDVLSWKKNFRNKPFFWLFLAILTFFSSFGVSVIPVLSKSNLLILFAVTFFNTILTFEFFFFLILFYLKWTGIKHNCSYQFIGDSIKYEFTSSKIILFLILVTLFFLGRSASGQIKDFSYLYYMLLLWSSLLVSLFITYMLVRDSMFGKNTFKIFMNKYDYYIGASLIFWVLLSWILEEIEKIHKYHVTDFINKNILYEYINYVLIYTSMIISLEIAIFVRDVYQIPLKYGGILAPESIQVINSCFFLIASGYILLKLSKKFEEKIIKAIEDEALVSMHRS